MRITWLILGLVTLVVVISLFMGGDPEQAARLDQMRRDAALTGEMRDIALLLLVLGLGGFIAYLTMTRR